MLYLYNIYLTCLLHDNTKIYRELSNIGRNSKALQWQLRFNSDKCEVLHMYKAQTRLLPPCVAYSLDTSLETVKCVKNLGIKVSSHLSWSEHVNVTANKDNKLLVRSPFYKSLVCPVLEYADPVWS